MHKLEVLKNKIKSGIYLATNNRKKYIKNDNLCFYNNYVFNDFYDFIFLCKKYK